MLNGDEPEMLEFDYDKILWGWESQPRNQWLRSSRYVFALAGWAVPEVVEKELPVMSGLEAWYDQGATPQCVGYSCSWNQTINAKIHSMDKKFNAPWLFKQAGGTNQGALINKAMDVLVSKGHVEVLNGVDQPVDLQDGLKSYVWASNHDDIRTAIYEDKPCVLGIYWHKKFMSPVKINGEWWIATESSWGTVLGGHAIVVRAASDKRKAFRLKNSWGSQYPEVWISYASVDKLIQQEGGECAVGLDRYVEPPPPPPPTTDQITIRINIPIGDKIYGGDRIALPRL